MAAAGYRIVKLANGSHSVHSLAQAETFHPVVGPVTEAQALYVTQARLRERLQHPASQPFVIWDVGLGAAANSLTVLHAARDISCEVRLISFDHTLAPLEFALAHPEHLEYLAGHQHQLSELLANQHVSFQEGDCSLAWDVRLADFPVVTLHAGCCLDPQATPGHVRCVFPCEKSCDVDVAAVHKPVPAA